MPFDPDAYLAAQNQEAPAAPKKAVTPPDNGFNPDVYLANQSGVFNPDAYLQQDAAHKAEALQAQYGTPIEQAKTAVEQGLSGATFGASKIIETQALGVNPEDIKGREAANPWTAGASNIAGTVGGLALGPGELFAAGKGAGLAARVGLGALEGATVGGLNQATDDWSQNKAVDAQKIAASAGIGALIGGSGAGVFAGLRALKGKFFPKAIPEEIPTATLPDNAGGPPPTEPTGPRPVVDAAPTGKAPTNYDDVDKAVKGALESGETIDLPQKAELEKADMILNGSPDPGLASATPRQKFPSLPGQVESLGSLGERKEWKTATLDPKNPAIQNYEALQKNDLVKQLGKTVEDISPSAPTSNAIEGGKQVIDAATRAYQAEQKAAGDMIGEFRKVSYPEGQMGQDMAEQMTNIPELGDKIAPMFPDGITSDNIEVAPFNSSWGITKKTYDVVADSIKTAQREDTKSTLESLWNIRKAVDSAIDPEAVDQSSQELRSIKAAIMEQMQTQAPNLRDGFRRYAINEGNREIVENSLGASVGNPNFSKTVGKGAEAILSKIFANSDTVNAYKSIVSPKDFQIARSNWLARQMETNTNLGQFSGNNFGSWLKKSGPVLQTAFADNPQDLQRLQALVTKMRILPDSVSINPSGTAETLWRAAIKHLSEFEPSKMTFEGMITAPVAAIPKKLAAIAEKRSALNELNNRIAGKAQATEGNSLLQKKASDYTKNMDSKINALFRGSTSQSRKINDGK